MISEILASLPGSFIAFFTVSNLWWCLIGSVIGMFFGAIPGLTATTAVAIFTPITFTMPFGVSMSFLLGIYAAGYYSGSIPAILLKTPGAPGNAATVMEGYPLALKGRAGEALGASVVSSWIGGIISALALLIFAPIISLVALKFGQAEYFSAAILGIVCVAMVSGKSLLKGVVSATIGMLLGVVGMDPIVGSARLTFGNINLLGGIALIPAIVALFAVTEVLDKVGSLSAEPPKVIQLKKIMPDLQEFVNAKWIILRGSVIGLIIGALPGIGPTIPSWLSYAETRRTSKNPEEYGQGVLDGVIASECANNAVPGGALIPLLTLGVPGDSVTAVLLAALMIQGLAPGPMFITNNTQLFGIMLFALIFANFFMLALGLAGARFFPYILKVSSQILMPTVIVLAVLGGFATNNSLFDVKMVAVLGITGYLLYKFDFPIAPIVLGLILGPIAEPNLRRALVASHMNPMIFVTRPISAVLLLLALVLAVFVLPRMLKQSQQVGTPG